MQITKVVITGAPCSGKTTIIDKIKSHYEAQGIATFLCKESATVVLKNGFDRSNVPAFEKEIACVQQIAEADIMAQLDNVQSDKVLIIYDRGLTDCFSYVDDLPAFCDMLGFDFYSTWCRYDAVIMLETTAVNGDIVNSDIRVESVDEALKAQDRLLDVYVGHPHLRYIKACDKVEDKLNNVISEIDVLLNNIELEKKLLIEYPDIAAIQKYKPYKAEISQTYLLCDNGSHRVRKRTTNGVDTYFETLKIRLSGSKSLETEDVITKARYDELMELADPDKNTIFKDRYCFLYEAQYFELDVFPFWDDKAFVELELTSEDDTLVLPPELKLIKDVSDDPTYKNNYLARLKL